MALLDRNLSGTGCRPPLRHKFLILVTVLLNSASDEEAVEIGNFAVDEVSAVVEESFFVSLSLEGTVFGFDATAGATVLLNSAKGTAEVALNFALDQVSASAGVEESWLFCLSLQEKTWVVWLTLYSDASLTWPTVVFGNDTLSLGGGEESKLSSRLNSSKFGYNTFFQVGGRKFIWNGYFAMSL